MNVNQHRSAPLHWLTALRYPATIWVIMKHCLHNFGDPNAVPDGLRKDFMERGFLGVPFFFILSGFILAYNYPVIASKRDYLAARAGRILPVYYLSLLVSLPILFKAISESGLHYALPRMAMYLTLTQAWIPSFTTIWNFPAWTLSCELFFYVSLIALLPFLTSVIGKSPLRAFTFIGVCVALGLVAPFWFHNHYGDPTMHQLEDPANLEMYNVSFFIKVFILFHFPEFLSGVALCVGLRSYLPQLRKYWALMVTVGGAQILTSLCFPAIFSQGSYCVPGFVILILGAAAAPYPDAEKSPAWKRFFAEKCLFLGNVSYAVYLFHIPVIFYICAINRHGKHILPEHETGVWTLYVVTVLLSTVIGWPIYRFYEQPMRLRVADWVKRNWGGLGSVEKIPSVRPESV